MDITQIPIVVISYNSPDLIETLLGSVRRFYSNKIYIIDGSDAGAVTEIQKVAQKYPHVDFIPFGYNIHHGPGMAWAIANLQVSGPVLFLDSDVELIKPGMIESLATYLQPPMYGVGAILHVDTLGNKVPAGAGTVPYLHPACMLCNIDVMRTWPAPIKHGAPMIEPMKSIAAAGKTDLLAMVDWVKQDFSAHGTKNYLVYAWRGTVNRTGGYHLDGSNATPPNAPAPAPPPPPAPSAPSATAAARPDYGTNLQLYNRDLLGFIPPSANKVIEVGCNVGALAAAFRALHPACDYRGVEIDAEAAHLARRQCSTVWQLDIETVDDAFFAMQSDRNCWVFGDVLEHLKDPWRTLERIRKVLPADGCIVACIPNAQNWRLQAKLAIGDFRYENGGLLDRTHLRWFTRATIFELFQSAGFRVTQGTPRIFDEPMREKVLPIIRKMAEAVGADADLAVQDALALQYVIKAVPA